MKQSSAARADGRPSCCDPRPAHPLESIHVLELGILIARPFTGRQLGAFGAKWRSCKRGLVSIGLFDQGSAFAERFSPMFGTVTKAGVSNADHPRASTTAT
jgi:hypothetical protein